MVNLRLQSILASMAKYYWILHYLSLLLSRLKHSFICRSNWAKCGYSFKENTRKSGDQKTGHRSVINYCLEESSYIMNNEESVQG